MITKENNQTVIEADMRGPLAAHVIDLGNGELRLLVGGSGRLFAFQLDADGARALANRANEAAGAIEAQGGEL